MDLTHFIQEKKKKKYFHNELKNTCDLHNKNYYKIHKLNCDQYFFLPHRNEARGDGGIFYDYLDFKELLLIPVILICLLLELLKHNKIVLLLK